MTGKGPYARVYQSIVDDPMFARVFENDHALATWLRMLLIADAMWPASAPMPPRNPTVRMLIDCGLVLHRASNRYSMRGLDAERERRSDAARNAAAVRWHSDRNADAMPNKAEQNRTEQTDGHSAPQTFMGFRRKPLAASLSSVQAQHAVDFEECATCGQRRGGMAHAPGRGDHPFTSKVGKP